MSNLLNSLRPYYPEDIAAIKARLPELGVYPDIVIEKLWKDFSRSVSAAWLIVGEETMVEFKEWLER